MDDCSSDDFRDGGPACSATRQHCCQQHGRLSRILQQSIRQHDLAGHLIDGSADKGWASSSAGPQSVIIGFKDNALAEIEDVIINPYTREDRQTWAKEIEIEVSPEFPFRGFQRVGKFTLANEGNDQVFFFPQPARARFVKVRFLSNYGGAYMEAGEIKVMGRLLPEAPPAPAFTSLGSANRGAKIEKFSSQYNDTTWAAANLIAEDSASQWAGTSSGSQEVVIALPEAAEVTDVAVCNYAREDPSNWAKDVEVELSADSSYKGYVGAGKMTLPKDGDLHTLTLAKPMRTRYVKVLFRSNHGGSYMEATRIRVYQAAPGRTVGFAQQLRETGRAVVYEIHFATNSAEILAEGGRSSARRCQDRIDRRASHRQCGRCRTQP